MNISSLFAVVIAFFFFSHTGMAQKSPAYALADNLTKEMALMLRLNEADIVLLQKFNRERFTKLAALQQLAPQLSQRQEDLKRSQLEQEYYDRIFSILNAQQYITYKRFRESRREFAASNPVMASGRAR